MATPLSFNASWYLEQNPDVAAAIEAGAPFNAQEHFMLYGRTEGRSASSLFDAQQYLTNNPDVAQAVAQGLITAWDHFELFGALEGRSPSPLFDAEFYLQQNPDVAAAIEQGIIQSAAQHFVLFGQSEPRAINPAIDLGRYLNANPDVAQAAANGLVNVFDHLAQFGVGEGRPLGNGVNLSDFANDPTFTQALSSGNGIAALVRAQEVAPFIPTFERPAGWTPPANTPIPVDFVPPAGSGITLVVPPEVVVPEGTVLPPTFDPVQPTPTPTPTPGGGGGATFTVTESNGVVNFNNPSGNSVTLTSLSDPTGTFANNQGYRLLTATDGVTTVSENVSVNSALNIAAGQKLTSPISLLAGSNGSASGWTITGAGTLEFSNAATVAQIASLDLQNTAHPFAGNAVYSLSDTAANLQQDAATNNGAGTYVTNKNVSLTDAHNLSQLVAINNATTGTITLANNGVPLSGSAPDIVAALNGITGYAGNLVVESITVGQATSGRFDLSGVSTTGTVTIALNTGVTLDGIPANASSISLSGTGAAARVPSNADFSKLDISGFSGSTFVVTPADSNVAVLTGLTVGSFTGGAFVVTAGSVDFATIPSFGTNANTLVINSPTSGNASLTGLDLSTFKGAVSLAGNANFTGLVLNSAVANSYEVIKSGSAKLLAEIPGNFSDNVVVDVDGSSNIVVTENVQSGTPKSITLKTGAADTKFVWKGAANSVLTIDDALTGTLDTSATSGSVIVVGGEATAKDISLSGFNTGNELASNVYVYADTGKAVDLSSVHFSTDYNKIVGIFGNDGNETITGSSKKDFIHLERGGQNSHGSDTVKFAATAETNGHDVIRGFTAGDVANGGDVLDFSSFLGTAATGLTAVVLDTAMAPTPIANGNILRVTDTGEALNAASIAALFGGTETVFAAPATNGKYVLLTDKGNIWYIANDNDTTISAGEVKLVGTIESSPGTGALTLNDLTNANFGI